ncbi:MAG: hypothetical protein J7463_11890 [Roseiflexus sp.]|nr:hypothetical protein [Roseiflexus sp.]
MTSLHVTQHAIPDACRVVVVADREVDFHPLVAAVRQEGMNVLIRTAQNRRVDADTQSLEAAIAATPVRGTLTIAVPQRNERPARSAQLTIRWTGVCLSPPQHTKGWAASLHIPGQVMVAEELPPPPGITTSVSRGDHAGDVTTWDDALQIVRWRSTR